MTRLVVGLCALLLAIPILAGGVAAGLLGGEAGGGGQPAPSPAAAQEIPAGYQRLYVAAAATCPGLPWTVLAAVGKVETDHGQNPDWTSQAGAQGPMQFLPTTFAAYRVDGDADGTADINNPADAIYSAANYLCASGARDGADISAALYTYNHDNSYVARVLTQADTYTTTGTSTGLSTTAGPSPAALTAVDYATAQIGLPYLWGGDGPDYGEDGFDCSGLTRAAYTAAGITIPRVAQDQFDAGSRLPPEVPLEIGDLVFYGTSDIDITHVGIYIGSGEMVNAPRRGAPVRTETYVRPSYRGATRPAPVSAGLP